MGALTPSVVPAAQIPWNPAPACLPHLAAGPFFPLIFTNSFGLTTLQFFMCPFSVYSIGPKSSISQALGVVGARAVAGMRRMGRGVVGVVLGGALGCTLGARGNSFWLQGVYLVGAWQHPGFAFHLNQPTFSFQPTQKMEEELGVC